jgi:hypothetical protein
LRSSVVALLALAGCAGDAAEPPAPIPCDEVGWSDYTEPLLTTWCTPCHSSTVPEENRRGAPVGVDFDTWAGAVQWADRIAVRAGPGGTMPPAGGLTDDQRAGLARWVECGADGTPSPPDPCAERVDHAGDASAAGEPCAEGANAVTGDLVIDRDPGHALDCVCQVDGAVTIGAPVTLPNLQRAGSVTIGSPSGAVALPALVGVGEVVVSGADLTALDLSALQSVDGNLVVVDSALPEVPLPRLGAVGENLVLRNIDGVALLELPRLESVGLDLLIEDNPSLVEVLHTSDLETVGRDLRIDGNAALASVEDFSFVSTVGGTLELGGGGGLRSIDGFFGLDSVEGDLRIHDEPALDSISGFLDLAVVRGTLEISGSGVVETDGFKSLARIGGLVVSDDPSLVSWGAGSAPEIYGDVVIARNPLLVELPALKHATRLDGALLLTELERLEDTSALDELASIGGDLEISRVGTLSAPGFAALTTIGGSLRLTQDPDLARPGLDALQAVVGDLTVTDNPSLPQPAVDQWLTGLSVGGTSTAAGNGG